MPESFLSYKSYEKLFIKSKPIIHFFMECSDSGYTHPTEMELSKRDILLEIGPRAKVSHKEDIFSICRSYETSKKS